MSLESEFVYAALDVNGLKGINDTLGHNAGDELIQGAAGMDAHITKPVNESNREQPAPRVDDHDGHPRDPAGSAPPAAAGRRPLCDLRPE